MDKAIRNLPVSFEQIGAKLADGKKQKVRRIVSLFSGCGGMDLGFVGGFKFAGRIYDRLPFEIKWANDLSPQACETYHTNLKHDIHCGDIAEVMDTLPARTDVVIGGFPCQDVSVNGKMAADKGIRTTLYRMMQEVVAATKPRIFVAENVKGILMDHSRALYDDLMQGFDSIGYHVIPRIYCAADYGVPQLRHRVFFVGTRKSAPVFEHPEPIYNQMCWMTAGEALGAFEKKEEDVTINHVWSRAKTSPEQGQRKLDGDRPSTTIRAECHGNQQFHYNLPRRISLREAARLQSFPDNFIFHGGMRHSERQIGNAVPPVLAWHIGRAVQEYLG